MGQKKVRRMLVFATALVGIAVLPSDNRLIAQTRDTAAIFGTVSDSQAAVIPGVTVTATSVNTGQVRTTTTNDAGGYLFSLLPVGAYSISMEHQGFRRSERKGILLRANENVKVDIALEVGEVQTTVQVDSAASQLETRSSTIKETVDRARVVELPLNGRNPADLALLAPGVTAGMGSNTGDLSDANRPRGTKQLSVNGSRNNNLRYTLDGGENMDNLYNLNLPFPFPDAVQEFSVQTSNMGLDQGSSGAGVVNVVTKSGTNQFHGSGFWFVRNTALNASNFFSRQQDQLKRNQTGFTLGGPVLKNKLFAFGGFQQLWIRQAAGDSRAQTLTAAERRGDFSATRITILDPRNGQPFPNNTIPQGRLSPAALSLQTVSPVPDADGFARFTFALPEGGKQYIGRLDYILNTKHNFTFRVFENDQVNPFHCTTNIHACRLAGFQDEKNATVSHNFTINARMIAHTQITGSHLVSKRNSDFGKSIRDFGVNVYAPSNDISVQLLNSGVSISSPQRGSFGRATEELLHDWTWTKGTHTFTWGAQFNWKQYNEDTIFNSSGLFRFDGHVTGFDRADFMLGEMSFFTQNNGELENRRGFTKGFYFGDIWRITPRLSLTLGVRYEPYGFFTDAKDRNQTFDLGNYQKGIKSKKFLNAPPGLLYPGDAAPAGWPCGSTISRRVTCSDDDNLAPRVGFAWDPFGDGRTSIRSGYAIFYDVPSLQTLGNSNDLSPFSYSVLFFDGLLDNPYLGREKSNRYPVVDFLPDTPYDSPVENIGVDRKWVTTYTQNWSFTLEREIVRDTRLRVAYVGTKATHLKAEYDQNAPIYNPNLTLDQNRATINARRPIQGFSRILRFYHGLNSNYNSLQVSVDKRYSRGFTILASYTWSKAIDYQSVNNWAQDAPPSNPFNFFLDRGVSSFHRAQRLVTSAVWDLPSPVSNQASPVVKALVRNWKVSGIVTLQAGRPFHIAATGDPLAGIAGARVDLIGAGNPVLEAGRSKGDKINAYFDKSRFQNPPPNGLGTLGRNSLEGPGFANVDISMVKGFRLPFLGEGGLGQFRFEAFNLFNRTNFGVPVTGITNSTFGRLTGTDGEPRILQLALKIAF